MNRNSLVSAGVVAAFAGLLPAPVQAQSDNLSFVTSNYIAVLGRDPDPGGWVYWTSLLNQGTTWLALTNGFITSTEYANSFGSTGAPGNSAAFVTLLYQNGLRRNPDISGMTLYQGQIDSGTTTRSQVADAIIASAEFASTNAARVGYRSAYALPGGTVLSGPASGQQLLTTTYTDTDGAGFIGYGQIVIDAGTGGPDGTGACYVAWDNIGSLSLLGGAPGLWGLMGQPSPGMTNGYCAVDALHSSQVRSGNTLTVTLALTFTAGFAGGHEAWSFGQNTAGLNSGWVDLGVLTTGSGVPLTISTSSLPIGTVNSAYSIALVASGGTPAYTWSLAAGALPAGMSLSAGGTLSGMPSTSGGAIFVVQTNDRAGHAVSASFTLAVAPLRPQIFSPTSAPALVYTDGVARTYGYTLNNGADSRYLTGCEAGADITVSIKTYPGYINFDVTYTSAATAQTGPRSVTCTWTYSYGSQSMPPAPVDAGVLQVNPAPQITSIQLLDATTALPIQAIPFGGTAILVIYGTDFGSAGGNVTLCAAQVGLCGSTGISAQVQYWGLQPGYWQVNALVDATSVSSNSASTIYAQLTIAGVAGLLLQTIRVPVQVRPVTCTSVQIVEETVSPGSLPLRNPATIRQGFAPVFEVTKTPANCGIQWSVSGPGSILGSSTSTLVTVRGNSVGTIALQASGFGGLTSTISVPVKLQLNINVYGVIVRDSSGNNPAVSVGYMMNDVAQANSVWEQAGVQFNLVPGGYVDSDVYKDSNSDFLRGILTTTTVPGFSSGFKVFYVGQCSDKSDLLGINAATGLVICIGNGTVIAPSFNTVLAHELGHAQGLPHRDAAGIPYISLMYNGYVTGLQADIAISELSLLINTTHQQGQ